MIKQFIHCHKNTNEVPSNILQKQIIYVNIWKKILWLE